jgi:hypothetical protein
LLDKFNCLCPQAYSLYGNFVFLRGKLIFKGATCWEGVLSVARRLVNEPMTLKAYLIIATSYMKRNLFVCRGCLLEAMLYKLWWVRVMHRHEVGFFVKY